MLFDDSTLDETETDGNRAGECRRNTASESEKAAREGKKGKWYAAAETLAIRCGLHLRGDSFAPDVT